jgi:hypothetical protein
MSCGTNSSYCVLRTCRVITALSLVSLSTCTHSLGLTVPRPAASRALNTARNLPPPGAPSCHSIVVATAAAAAAAAAAVVSAAVMLCPRRQSATAQDLYIVCCKRCVLVYSQQVLLAYLIGSVHSSQYALLYSEAASCPVLELSTAR